MSDEASACLSENQIVRFFDPRQRAAVAPLVDAHTATCDRCRRLLAEYADIGCADTSVTQPHVPDFGSSAAAAVPSLTPTTRTTEIRNERVERVQRLAQAQARKHIGSVLKGKWEIEKLVGTGGMAHVFAARHGRNGRRVAIKTMRPELVLEQSLVERFLREGYVANKIEHEGAVTILDDDVMEDGTPFIVMELLDGRTLREKLDGGPLPLGQALKAIAQVLDVLAVAHEKGIVHRDLKPDNLFETDPHGKIKILDFGIARLKERARPELETRSGLTMGTVGYMPPEQARGLATQVDARSDVWATGATLYSLITGKRLHQEAETTNEALLFAMTRPIPPMATLVPGLPRPVEALLDRALAFEKENRFESARAMKDALDRAMVGVTETTALVAAPPSTTRSRKNPVVVVGALLAAAIAGGVYVNRSVPPSAPTKMVASEEAAPISIASSTTTTAAPIETPTAPASPSTTAATTPPTTKKPTPRPKPIATATASASATPATPRLSEPPPADTRDPLGPQH